MKQLFGVLLLICSITANSTELSVLSEEFTRTQQISPKMADSLVKLANEGNTQAMLILADITDAGINMNAPGVEWAFNWTLKAARAGNPKAAYMLALRYFDGKGTPNENSPEINKTRGTFWLNRAALSLVPEALMLLAEAYKTGQISGVNLAVNRSEEKSLRFLRLAAAQDHPPAFYALFKAFHNPENSRFNEEELLAREYLEKCVELVEPNCLYEAAKISFTGDKNVRDVGLGLAYLQKASTQGLKKAGLMHDVVVAMLNDTVK